MTYCVSGEMLNLTHSLTEVNWLLCEGVWIDKWLSWRQTCKTWQPFSSRWCRTKTPSARRLGSGWRSSSSVARNSSRRFWKPSSKSRNSRPNCRWIVHFVTRKAGIQPKAAAAQARSHGLWPMQLYSRTQLYSAVIKGLHLLDACKYMQYYSFADSGGAGRLSWPGWLTHSRQFTHKVVTCQP